MTIRKSKTEKDITRYVRDIKKYVKNDELDNYFEDHKETTKELHEKLEEMEHVTVDKIKENIRADEKFKEKSKKINEKYIDKGKLKEAKEQPIKLLEKMMTILEEIDVNAINKMDEENKDRFKYNLNNLIEKLDDIEENI